MKTGAKAAILLGCLGLAGVAAYKGCSALVYDEVNKPAGLALAAAVEAYAAEHKRYPARLEDLVPKHMPALPRPARYTIIAYAPLPDGTQCYIAYTVHRDYFDEYDCRLRRWNTRDYEDTQALRYQPQLLKGES